MPQPPVAQIPNTASSDRTSLPPAVLSDRIVGIYAIHHITNVLPPRLSMGLPQLLQHAALAAVLAPAHTSAPRHTVEDAAATIPVVLRAESAYQLCKLAHPQVWQRW